MIGRKRNAVEETIAKRPRRSGAAAGASDAARRCKFGVRALAPFAGPADGEDGAIVLPDELMSPIFNLLDVADRFCASRVCRRWRAIAYEPPHSTRFSIRLRHEWVTKDVSEGRFGFRRRMRSIAECDDALDVFTSTDEVQWPAAAWAPDPTALTEAGLRAALNSPLAKGVEKLSVTLGRASGPPRPRGGKSSSRAAARRRWPLRALLEAMPPSVTSLEIVNSDAVAETIALSDEADIVAGQLERLQELAPQLREFVLRKFEYDGNDLTGQLRPLWLPAHGALERLDVGPAALPTRGLPSLQRLGFLDLSRPTLFPGDLVRALNTLVRRGLRVRSLNLGNMIFLADQELMSALSAILQPKAGGFEFCSGPATLELDLDKVPSGGLPDAFAADTEEIIAYSSQAPRRSILPWLTGLSRRDALQALWLQLGAAASAADEPCASPRELLAALQGCRGGLRIELRWPSSGDPEPAWEVGAGLPDACAFLTQDRALLRAVSIRFESLSELGTKGLAAFLPYAAERFDALVEARAPLKSEARKLLREVEKRRGILNARTHMHAGWALSAAERAALEAYEAFVRRAKASARWGVPK